MDYLVTTWKWKYVMCSRALKINWLWAIAAASFISIFAVNLPFPAIVVAAALVGYMGGRVAPDKFKAGGGHNMADTSFGAALFDDHSPTSAHAQLSWVRLAKILVVGALLWAAHMALLTTSYGWEHPLTQMS